MTRALYWFPIAVVPCMISPAWAHAFLERAQPPAGSEIAAAPHELVLTFSESLEPRFSTVQLRDPSGATVMIDKPHTAPSEDRKLVVQLPVLRSGTYTVIYHVTSVDTHKSEGSFKFTITH